MMGGDSSVVLGRLMDCHLLYHSLPTCLRSQEYRRNLNVSVGVIWCHSATTEVFGTAVPNSVASSVLKGHHKLDKGRR